MSGRTEKTSGALFAKECARGCKILSDQMHPCIKLPNLLIFKAVYISFELKKYIFSISEIKGLFIHVCTCKSIFVFM